jgi:hypothetical protein
MNLRSFLRTLAFASVCALPLPAGIVTINFTQTVTNTVVVTLSGRLDDASAWSFIGSTPSSPQSAVFMPLYGVINFGGVGDQYFPVPSPVGSWTQGFGGGLFTDPASSRSGDGFIFSRAGELVLPTGYNFNSPPNSLNSTMTFAGDFSYLGIIPTGTSVTYGGDEIRLTFTFGGGGGSSVPDAGPGPALALLLGGLGLRQWRSSRRSRAAA